MTRFVCVCVCVLSVNVLDKFEQKPKNKMGATHLNVPQILELSFGKNIPTHPDLCGESPDLSAVLTASPGRCAASQLHAQERMQGLRVADTLPTIL